MRESAARKIEKGEKKNNQPPPPKFFFNKNQLNVFFNVKSWVGVGRRGALIDN